ncbi:S8 family peptidase [Kineococcus sp. LSe6-4]|uniref:S8 family peptidase n=1 Tax=Kineococcus halophytocola TaxID=3234027 RepID=A0ABV4H2F8_9ACTN
MPLLEATVVARRPLTTSALAMGVGLLLTVAPALPATAAPPPATAPPSSQAADRTFTDGDYVVTLAQDPIAGYDGSLPGIPRLKSAGGDLDLARPTTRRYRDLLLSAQTKVADVVGAVPQQRYTVALNGFSARLTGAQAKELAATAGVVSVAPDVTRHLADPAEAGAGSSPETGTETGTESGTESGTDSASETRSGTDQATDRSASTLKAPARGARTTADYLGLTGPGGVWDRLGGPGQAGRGVVVADLDTGLWPEHPSVAGAKLPTRAPADDPHGPYRSGSTIRMTKADGGTYTGVCQTGERWSASNCSTKVVGARSFSDGFRQAHALGGEEFDSARDSDGHGTHTGTTAVGRTGVPATIRGEGYGDVTGIAPAAALAVYKVCWTSEEGDNGCQTSDLVAAIDQAVADNVDVINYSIGSDPSPDPADPVETAFLVAASAGIFVSASAGNSGPGASTVDHQSPWVTTVAAATSVLREGTVVLGDGTKLVGARLQREPLPSAPLVLGSAVRIRQAPADDADKCLDGSLDPAKAKGKIVVCERAITARVAKSAEVARVGGAGMVLYNPVPNSLEPDAHTVPTVHLDTREGERLVAYVRGHRRPTASFQAGNTSGRPTATPQVSAFSSRGPALVDDGDVLKPDVTAPGSGIVAGYSPVASADGEDLFAPESGTSMSAPHVTGLAALHLAAHPEFTPMMVKSALMTTARDVVSASGRPVRRVLSAGAGFVDPAAMLTPGLVYDSTPLDWLRWLEGSGVDTGTGLEAVDPSDLNQPSIAVGDLVGSRTVTRSVTAVTGGFYYAQADVPGFDVQVQPSVLNLQPGQTGRFRVTLTRTTAPVDQWSSGWLTWTGGDRLTVRSPVALKPLTLGGVPAELTAPASRSGSVRATVLPGTSGPLDLTTAGLVAGETRRGRVDQGDVREFPVTIPEGTTFTRFDLVGQPGSDLDLYLYTEGGTLVGQSAAVTADERIDGFVEPGRYVLQVSGYAGADGGPDAGYALTSFVLGAGPGTGTFRVAPDPLLLEQGRPATLTASWRGLDPARRYLGTITYGDTGQRTVLAVG